MINNPEVITAPTIINSNKFNKNIVTKLCIKLMKQKISTLDQKIWHNCIEMEPKSSAIFNNKK